MSAAVNTPTDPRRRTVLRTAGLLGVGLLFGALAPRVFGAANTEPAELRGILLDGEGLPAAGHQVLLRTAAGDLSTSPATEADGSFVVAGLAPGVYQPAAVSPEGSEFAVVPAQITLKAGETARGEFRLTGKAKPPGRERRRPTRRR